VDDEQDMDLVGLDSIGHDILDDEFPAVGKPSQPADFRLCFQYCDFPADFTDDPAGGCGFSTAM